MRAKWLAEAEAELNAAAHRRHLLARFPYSVIYEVTDIEIRILAVAHAGQRPGYWKKRLK